MLFPQHRVWKGCLDHNCFSSSLLWRISCFARFLSAFTSTEYNPCFQRDRRDLANPSGVWGPVLAPPCIRHRPLCIAGDWHGVARRVIALHRGALFGSPVGFPFFSHPLRRVCVLGIGFSIIFSRNNRRSLMIGGTYELLGFVVDGHWLNVGFLQALASALLEAVDQPDKGLLQHRG